MKSPGTVEHFFRHQYGKLVAMLSRRFGLQHLETVEDAVQSALMAACEAWGRSGEPDNPSAWLYTVAYKKLAGELRQNTRHGHLLEQARERIVETAIAAPQAQQTPPEAYLDGDIPDDLLRMLFVCCEEKLPEQSQLILALKTLCGFDVREIAQRLFLTEANVYKRLGRARLRLAECAQQFDELSQEQYALRVPAVQKVLYLLFTEGYLSSHATMSIRRELCDEAIRLATVLATHPCGASPETSALLALMYLHVARLAARTDPSGGLLLLEEQDREQWDREDMAKGFDWLARSAEGASFSRFHAEAGIAAEHCLAPKLADTRWERVVSCYDLLEQQCPSALHRLNRAVATAEWQGAEAGLSLLQGLEPPSWLAGSYLWSAVHADLHWRCGHPELAQSYRRVAIDTAPSMAIAALLRRRLRM